MSVTRSCAEEDSRREETHTSTSSSSNATVEQLIHGRDSDQCNANSDSSLQYHDLYSSVSSGPVKAASFPILEDGSVPRSILRQPGSLKRSSTERHISFIDSDGSSYEECEESEASEEPSLTYQSRIVLPTEIPNSPLHQPSQRKLHTSTSSSSSDDRSSTSFNEPRLIVSKKTDAPPRERSSTPLGVQSSKVNVSTSELFSQESSTLLFDNSVDPADVPPSREVPNSLKEIIMVESTRKSAPQLPGDITASLNATGETLPPPPLEHSVSAAGGTSPEEFQQLGLLSDGGAKGKKRKVTRKKIVVITRRKRSGVEASESDPVVRRIVVSSQDEAKFKAASDEKREKPPVVQTTKALSQVASCSVEVPAVTPSPAVQQPQISNGGVAATKAIEELASHRLGITPVNIKLFRSQNPYLKDDWLADSHVSDSDASSDVFALERPGLTSSPVPKVGGVLRLDGMPLLVGAPVVQLPHCAETVQAPLLPISADIPHCRFLSPKVKADCKADSKPNRHSSRRSTERISHLEVSPRWTSPPKKLGSRTVEKRVHNHWEGTLRATERVRQESELIASSVYGAGETAFNGGSAVKPQHHSGNDVSAAVLATAGVRHSQKWTKAPHETTRHRHHSRKSSRNRWSEEARYGPQNVEREKTKRRSKERTRGGPHHHIIEISKSRRSSSSRHRRRGDHHHAEKRQSEHRQRSRSTWKPSKTREKVSRSHPRKEKSSVSKEVEQKSIQTDIPPVREIGKETIETASKALQSPEPRATVVSPISTASVRPTNAQERSREDRRAAIRKALAEIQVKRNSVYFRNRSVFVDPCANRERPSPSEIVASEALETSCTAPRQPELGVRRAPLPLLQSEPHTEHVEVPASFGDAPAAEIPPDGFAWKPEIRLARNSLLGQPLIGATLCRGEESVILTPQAAREFAESVERITHSLQQCQWSSALL